MRVTCDGVPLAFPDAAPSPRVVVSELEAKFPTEHVDAYASVVSSALLGGAETL